MQNFSPLRISVVNLFPRGMVLFQYSENSFMKHVLNLMAAGTLLIIACNSAPEADKAKTTDEQVIAASTGREYKVNTGTSKIEWVGTKQNGEHHGTFHIKDGEIAVDKGNITGGSFSIDMASVTNIDQKGEPKQKLEAHLKSPDFFEVEKFPTAKFVITNVEPYDSSKNESVLPGATHLISGNLTLKDSTKNVTFPAKVNVDNNNLTAQADFNINRVDWGINYKGANNPKDWLIKKQVNLKLDIQAAKK